MKINKILILQDRLSSYNIPLYNLLSSQFDLTVSSVFKDNLGRDINFKFVKIERISFGPFYFIKNNFFRFCKDYDVVIFSPNLHYLSFCVLPFTNFKFKTIAWTIGIRASYTKRYDVYKKKNLLDIIYGKILNQCNALIFYMDEPKKYWANIIDYEKIFVAHNTVEVIRSEFAINSLNGRILFVGTLYKEKKIYELLNAFLQARKNSMNNLKLDIVGNGPEFNNVLNFVKDHGLTENIFLHGEIYDEIVLSKIFANSLVCISPDQAGLTVLKSMGYGRPFVTRRDAITGGERLNVIDGVNGLLYNNYSDLVEIIVKVANNPNYFIQLGQNAQKYYDENATINHMAKGFIDAVNFVAKDL
jgi:glycosyltransferase involved in cell wall biosynthesis